ncbi:MAG: hypothetical protein LIP28_09995, partial [Deltaproteobacteria bacterium]|nr:hypothetical protein [Deltaproteobacteria bacterium]
PNNAFTLKTPKGYVPADKERYAEFLVMAEDTLGEIDMTLLAAYIPEDIDARRALDPSTTMDKYILVTSFDPFEGEVLSRKDFAKTKADIRENPDMLMRAPVPGTAEYPRRIGLPYMKGNAVYYGFLTRNNAGRDVLGAGAFVHTGTTAIQVYLYELMTSPDDIQNLMTEAVTVVPEMGFPPPEERDGKPFILAGTGVALFAFLLGIFFVFRSRKAG